MTIKDYFFGDDETRMQVLLKYAGRMGVLLVLLGFGITWGLISETLREAHAGKASVDVFAVGIIVGTFSGIFGVLVLLSKFYPSIKITLEAWPRKKQKFWGFVLVGLSILPLVALKIALAKMGYSWF